MAQVPVPSPLGDLLVAREEFAPTDEMRRAVITYATWLQTAQARGKGRISFPELAAEAGLPEDTFDRWIGEYGFEFAGWFNNQVLAHLALYYPMVQMTDILVSMGMGSPEAAKQVASSSRERLAKIYDPRLKERHEIETRDVTWSDGMRAMRGVK